MNVEAYAAYCAARNGGACLTRAAFGARLAGVEARRAVLARFRAGPRHAHLERALIMGVKRRRGETASAAVAREAAEVAMRGGSEWPEVGRLLALAGGDASLADGAPPAANTDSAAFVTRFLPDLLPLKAKYALLSAVRTSRDMLALADAAPRMWAPLLDAPYLWRTLVHERFVAPLAPMMRTFHDYDREVLARIHTHYTTDEMRFGEIPPPRVRYARIYDAYAAIFEELWWLLLRDTHDADARSPWYTAPAPDGAAPLITRADPFGAMKDALVWLAEDHPLRVKLSETDDRGRADAPVDPPEMHVTPVTRLVSPMADTGAHCYRLLVSDNAPISAPRFYWRGARTDAEVRALIAARASGFCISMGGTLGTQWSRGPGSDLEALHTYGFATPHDMIALTQRVHADAAAAVGGIDGAPPLSISFDALYILGYMSASIGSANDKLASYVQRPSPNNNPASQSPPPPPHWRDWTLPMRARTLIVDDASFGAVAHHARALLGVAGSGVLAQPWPGVVEVTNAPGNMYILVGIVAVHAFNYTVAGHLRREVATAMDVVADYYAAASQRAPRLVYPSLAYLDAITRGNGGNGDSDGGGGRMPTRAEVELFDEYLDHAADVFAQEPESQRALALANAGAALTRWLLRNNVGGVDPVRLAIDTRLVGTDEQPSHAHARLLWLARAYTVRGRTHDDAIDSGTDVPAADEVVEREPRIGWIYGAEPPTHRTPTHTVAGHDVDDNVALVFERAPRRAATAPLLVFVRLATAGDATVAAAAAAVAATGAIDIDRNQRGVRVDTSAGSAEVGVPATVTTTAETSGVIVRTTLSLVDATVRADIEFTRGSWNRRINGNAVLHGYARMVSIASNAQYRGLGFTPLSVLVTPVRADNVARVSKWRDAGDPISEAQVRMLADDEVYRGNAGNPRMDIPLLAKPFKLRAVQRRVGRNTLHDALYVLLAALADGHGSQSNTQKETALGGALHVELAVYTENYDATPLSNMSLLDNVVGKWYHYAFNASSTPAPPRLLTRYSAVETVLEHEHYASSRDNVQYDIDVAIVVHGPRAADADDARLTRQLRAIMARQVIGHLPDDALLPNSHDRLAEPTDAAALLELLRDDWVAPAQPGGDPTDKGNLYDIDARTALYLARWTIDVRADRVTMRYQRTANQ
jgi:hypothetical protein